MTKRDDESEIIERAKQGDKTAFDELVRQHQFKVMKVVGRYIRDPHEVLDVSQEVFIKVYRALPIFRGESSFYTWVYRIAVNTAKNYITAQSRRPSNAGIELGDISLLEYRPGVKEVASPEHELYSSEIQSTISKVIDALPKELRTAILLRELEGLSYDEIANVMDCPVGTVRSRIFRAREALDKEIKPLLTDD